MRDASIVSNLYTINLKIKLKIFFGHKVSGETPFGMFPRDLKLLETEHRN